MFLAGGLAACAGSHSATPYRPPTVAVQTTPLVLLAPTPTASIEVVISATATPACTNNLAFKEDVTIPDGTVVSPGALLDKRWKVQNSGTCNWDERYHIQFVSGQALGAPTEQALYPARGGSELTIQIIFTAPTEPGLYESAWQAYDPDGNAFGDPFFIQVEVEASAP
jgi:hypothetical protein